MRHPMQPLVMDKGVWRFKKNAIVAMLLDSHPTVDMNAIALATFSQNDREQFAQLIGYSCDGFYDLSYASKKSKAEMEDKER